MAHAPVKALTELRPSLSGFPYLKPTRLEVRSAWPRHPVAAASRFLRYLEWMVTSACVRRIGDPFRPSPVMRAALPMPRALTSSCLALRSGSARHRADHGVCEDARFCKMNVTSDLGLDGTEAGVHALPDHAAFELGEGARYVEE